VDSFLEDPDVLTESLAREHGNSYL
jgi:hypothetical protein